jgi:putative ABC transport system permease protein
MNRVSKIVPQAINKVPNPERHMTALTRGIRNVYRNKVRTLIVIAILSLSIGIFLTMVIVDEGVNDEIEEVQTNVGTTIEVRPAGSYGGFSFGGGRPGGIGGPGGSGSSGGTTGSTDYVNESVARYVESIPHVSSVSRSLQTMDQDMFAMVLGVDPTPDITLMDGSSGELIGGLTLDYYNSTDRVVLISSQWGEDNGVSDVGDTVTLNGTEFEVIGIFSSETRFGARSIFIPIETAQEVYNLSGSLTQITVSVDSLENVDWTYDFMQSNLDSDEVDIVHPGDANDNVVTSLESIAQSSETSAYVSLGVGCVIIFFIMTLVTRERRREIGTLKAIGASDLDVLKQFMVETMSIALIGALVGLIIASVFGNAIADAMVGEDEQDTGFKLPTGVSDEQRQRFDSGPQRQDRTTPETEALESISYGMSGTSIMYAFAVAVLMGILGVLYPAIHATRMKPVEALRSE